MIDKYKIISIRSSDDHNINEIHKWIDSATRAREIDLQNYDNLDSTAVRFYTYIPSSSSDLLGTEKAGDLAADTSYIYIVVDNSGTLQWQRVATATF